MLASPEALIARAPHLLLAEIGGETVLMNPDGSAYFGLAATAHAVWRHLETPLRLESLCQKLQTEFEGPADEIRADTVAFVARLLEKGLIEVA
ncbi:PqqD family protein [Oleisolibacter albus]|uniref:PqqD family protein n=1 Tax=Oleisolibacter albus TaxID=2171757 RepID=UPI000DF1BFE6|nr:PqqD family protein [Oleisolibacter albus]